MQGRWPDAISACRRAISDAESVGELRALAHACYVLDWALVESGRREEAVHSARALEIYQQLGDLEHEFLVLNNLGGFAYWDGQWDDAIALYRRAGACAERAGRPADAAYTDGNLGEILSDQGRLEEAEVHLQRARRVFSGTSHNFIPYADVLLGRLAVRRGRLEEGLPMLEAAMAQLRKLGIDAYADLAQALVAEAEAFAGDPVRALDIARRSLQANDRLRPLLTRVAGIALARMGEKATAVGELTDSLQSARERGAPYDIAATIDALAALGAAEPALIAERDEILGKLRIRQLPRPIPAARAGGTPTGGPPTRSSAATVP
jgi:tetratricopeptide (TPR) repeat protein